MNILYLTILFPLIGYLLLAFSQGRWSENLSATIGIGSVGLSALITIIVGIDFLNRGQLVFIQKLWTWINLHNFNIKFNLMLDGLALTMLSVITIIGFLIHVFASWYMRGEKGYSRFFAYTNFFIASMIVLVLADNLMVMYLGWELVGLCSYLLIGFYYSNSKNNIAAMKAFIITRVGDVFFMFALFILYNEFNTLSISRLIEIVPLHIITNNYTLQLITLMLLCGAVGKSAQLPLHTWLADAMVGPTPVSALIHAATMVTAGVYLIARTYFLFLLTPNVLYLVSILGVITLIFASICALVQTDIKRVLAYSTMSQIGYMFLALGIRAWSAAIFHLVMHAFFKALLFLSSGSLILACQHEQNILKMGGLRKSLLLLYICFLVGGASLSSLPLITAGFYSKDQILFEVLANGHFNLMVTGLVGTFLTSIYTFRMIFIVFHGKLKINNVNVGKGITHNLPLISLLILSTFIGAMIRIPLNDIVPQTELSNKIKIILEVVSSIITIVGIITAGLIWLNKHQLVIQISNSRLGRWIKTWCFMGWGFDWLYEKIFVKTYLRITCLLKHDPINSFMKIPVLMMRTSSKGLVRSVNGYLRWYIASMSMGAIIVLIFIIIQSMD